MNRQPNLNIPTRSYLYPLRPMGLGTSKVESLVSYLSRLAQAHWVTGSCLYARLLYPLAEWGKEMTCHSEILRAYSSFYSLRQVNERTGKVIHALENITCQPSLMSLTHLTWKRLLDQPIPTRKYRAWCPPCYRDWQATRSVMYEPLSWSLQIVKVCSRHQFWLESLCPNCERQLRTVDSRLRAGFCSYCRHWLGGEGHRDVNALENKDLNYQVWVTKNIEQLLGFTFPTSESPLPVTFQASVIQGITHLLAGESHLFEGQLPGSEKLIFRLQGKYAKSKIKRVPKLDLLLTICLILKISLLDLLLELSGHAKTNPIIP